MTDIFVHDINFGSYANGPGRRTVLHVSGCSIRCAGCFSPFTWKVSDERKVRTVEGVAKLLMSVPAYGLSISGGEPSEQLTALYELLSYPGLQEHFSHGGVLIYSGREKQDLYAQPTWNEMVRANLVDVLVVGPYIQGLRISKITGLRSSANQEVVFITDLFNKHDFSILPTVEIRVTNDTVTLHGFPRREDVALIEAISGGAERQEHPA